MRGDTHVRFGGRARETDPGQPGHRARARPNRSDTLGSCPTVDYRWSATRPSSGTPHGFSQASHATTLPTAGKRDPRCPDPRVSAAHTMCAGYATHALGSSICMVLELTRLSRLNTTHNCVLPLTSMLGRLSSTLNGCWQRPARADAATPQISYVTWQGRIRTDCRCPHAGGVGRCL